MLRETSKGIHKEVDRVVDKKANRETNKKIKRPVVDWPSKVKSLSPSLGVVNSITQVKITRQLADKLVYWSSG